MAEAVALKERSPFGLKIDPIEGALASFALSARCFSAGLCGFELPHALWHDKRERGPKVSDLPDLRKSRANLRLTRKWIRHTMRVLEDKQPDYLQTEGKMMTVSIGALLLIIITAILVGMLIFSLLAKRVIGLK